MKYRGYKDGKTQKSVYKTKDFLLFKKMISHKQHICHQPSYPSFPSLPNKEVTFSVTNEWVAIYAILCLEFKHLRNLDILMSLGKIQEYSSTQLKNKTKKSTAKSALSQSVFA